MEGSFSARLQELVAIYSRTKKLVLRAEQIDPGARSNIAIFKEQRDALDHIMRAMAKQFESPGNGECDEYCASQFDKARGHLYRAAYDALDGIGVSWKLRINDYLKGVSNEAIKAVYPTYYTEHLPKLDDLDRLIAAHRERKDVVPTTLENLQEYETAVERLAEIGEFARGRVGAIADWNRRERGTILLWKIVVPIGVGILVGILLILVRLWWHTDPQIGSPKAQSTVATAATPSPYNLQLLPPKSPDNGRRH
jgi:hypothetical protein